MNTGNLNNSVTKINNIRFSDTWIGSAAEVQVETLNSFMEDFNKCISDLNDFNFILDKRKKYEEICSQILDLYVAIDSCNVDHDDPDSSCSCGTYAAKIAELEKQRLDLRN